jgi:phospho-N-acetylmuramoyl-pentapeptide-transferase
VSYALLWAAATALIAAALGAPLIRVLKANRLGKAISTDGPESHMSKAGTPTMGGLLFMGVGLAMALAVAVPKDRDVLLPVLVGALLTAIGAYDDLGTLIDRERREAHDRTTMVLKLIAFGGVGVLVALSLYASIEPPKLLVPHYGSYDIGPVYVLIAIGVFVATTASVGVTDGLDMLLGSTTAVCFAAFGAIALMQDQEGLGALCFVMTGALLGFLFWNAFPARLFMGDTGSLPLGAMLAIVALMSGWWLLLPLIGIIYVVEGLSVAIQIAYFRTTGGKRFFRMAPIHHHFEKLDYHETTIAVRFLLITVVGALAGVALAALD